MQSLSRGFGGVISTAARRGNWSASRCWTVRHDGAMGARMYGTSTSTNSVGLPATAEPAAIGGAAAAAQTVANVTRLKVFAGRGSELFHAYLKLGKFKLSALVVYTGVVGYVIGSDERNSVNYYTKLAHTVVGTGLCAASANCLNQIYERASDARMYRTRMRPLPTKTISVRHAALFSVVSGACGVAALWYGTDRVTASLGAANIALYAAVYTPLKVIHPINTWIGALVGALPPLMGWSAANDGDLRHPGAILLGALLFSWQIPHFHGLASLCSKDYLRGGYKMLALIDPKKNAWWAASMAYAMLPFGPLAFHFGLTSPIFAAEALAANLWIIRSAEKFLQTPMDVVAARRLFRASITFLPVVLTAMMVHRKPRGRRGDGGGEHAGEDGSQPAKRVSAVHPVSFAPTYPFLPCPRHHPIRVAEETRPQATQAIDARKADGLAPLSQPRL